MNKDLEERAMLMMMKDWRRALRTPPSYRIGKSPIRFQPTYVIGVSLLSVVLLFMLVKSYDLGNVPAPSFNHLDRESALYKYNIAGNRHVTLNLTYPLTPPRHINDKVHFKVGAIADKDEASRSKDESNTWVSTYITGTLIWDQKKNHISVNWDKNSIKPLKSKYSYGGRGMELSELVTYNGNLLTFDDRGGLVYVLKDDKVYPWVLLTDGEGKIDKGFKSEWATVKDGHLYVGSMGKEWTTPTGEFVNYNPMWVKKISKTGEVESLDWKNNYKTIRSSLGINFPGYLLHESACWSDYHNKWFFLPRRMSHYAYNEDKDQYQGTNVLISCDENFNQCHVTQVGEVVPTHGFSSFKFMPGTHDNLIVAIKSYEVNGKLESYVMAFDTQGKILLGETKIDNSKFEGFDFI
ncbi:apyrase-like [Cimex lectularius]|uniref:Apyrase n=1 Tax=Cimex lectularius TaxID=79782 RepID=A0A8I6S0Z8_CIMLE|nr:apyrase-like [Cimex lectularius]